jgi:hypothetical protein
LEEVPRDEIERRERLRSEVWERAAKEHLFLKPGGVMDLATKLNAWRHLEATNPAWRENKLVRLPGFTTPEKADEFYQFFDPKRFLSEAMTFDRQYREALLNKDRVFLRRVADACRITKDDFVASLTQEGCVLMAWEQITILHILDGRRASPPTKHEITSWVARNLREYSTRSWQRVWKRPLIAELLDCP